MKIFKTILLIGVFLSITNAVYALTVDTSNWYEYNGSSKAHSFKLKFPTDWKARTFGEELQGFAPATMNEDALFMVEEFEGKSFDDVINYYTNTNRTLVSSEDIILSTSKEDVIAKEIIYKNVSEGKQYMKTIIKRGSLIISLSNPNIETGFPVEEKYNDQMQGIFSSFTFTDNWHQYIDFNEKYTFIFPTSLKINHLSNGVEIYDSSQIGETFFRILKYPATSLARVARDAEGYGETFVSEKDVYFHGLENAITAVYLDSAVNKNVSRVYVENDGDTYSLTNVNMESNYPHLNYYDKYVIEILESFEFFNIVGEYHSFINFPDVRDNHPNAKAINSLKSDGVIAGYPDGNFKPDGEINRAELTKMIVATVLEPDATKYNNCFPDVKDEWFAAYICYAKEKGWVEGYSNGNFKPDSNINRVEAMKIVLEVLASTKLSETAVLNNKTVLDVDTADWYGKYFIYADNNNLLDKQHIVEENGGYKYFPAENISRKEVAEMIYRSQK